MKFDLSACRYLMSSSRGWVAVTRIYIIIARIRWKISMAFLIAYIIMTEGLVVVSGLEALTLVLELASLAPTECLAVLRVPVASISTGVDNGVIVPVGLESMTQTA